MNWSVMLRPRINMHANPAWIRAGGRRGAAIATALWLFIGVATTLFSLFLFTYVMRMTDSDWTPIAMPWQLWFSSALLLAGSVTMQCASGAAHGGQRRDAAVLLLAGGACALAFVCVQLWAWQVLLEMRVVPSGNPAAGFFYLLTAMHGLHVAGGLAAWCWTADQVRDNGIASEGWRIGLCARYWHFLLILWAVLFAVLGWLTPDMVAFICGTR